MEFREGNECGSIVFYLEGTAKGPHCVGFCRRVESYKDDICCKKIIIDLNRVDFMDSRAVGGLIYLSKTMHNSGIELIMRGPNNHIRKLFKDCSLDEILTVENGRDAEGINTTVGWREE